MANFRQAPRLYFNGDKGDGRFYSLPHELMDTVFRQLNGKQGNQIKLMIALFGTIGDGTFRISQKWICDRTGMNQSNYVRARQALIEKGWLEIKDGNIYINFDVIKKTASEEASTHADEMSSEYSRCDDSINRTCDDDMHNRKVINNHNTKIIEKDHTVVPKENPDVNMKTEDIRKQVVFKLKALGIDFRPNSKKAVEEIIGEKLDYYVLDKLINRFYSEFRKARYQPESYLFGILKKKVKEEYKKEKILSGVQSVQEEDTNAPSLQKCHEHSIDHEMKDIESNNMIDISDQLLELEIDDMDECFEREPPQSLRILQKMKEEGLLKNDDSDDFVW